MKALLFILSISVAANLSAQSLQDSFNKALTKADQPETEKTIVKTEDQILQLTTLAANIDYSQNGVQLKWNITPKDNTDKFIIEKSIDKITWLVVNTVSGPVNKKQNIEYFYLDDLPMENLSYYRVHQVSKKGKEIISNIIPVNYILTDYKTAGMNLFPIANDGEEFKITNIAWEEIFDREILLVLRDKKGEEFYSKAIINIENEKLIAVPIENEIPKGDYLITASSENQIYSQNITVN